MRDESLQTSFTLLNPFIPVKVQVPQVPGGPREGHPGVLRSVRQAEVRHHPQVRALSEVWEELSLLHHHQATFQIWQRMKK